MLSADRIEFCRLCEAELNRATELTGAFDRMDGATRAAAEARLHQIAMDMVDCLPNRIPCSRVPELFRVARAHYSRVPCVNDLQKAWDNHMKPKAEAPTPADRPQLEAPRLGKSEAQMRHLAAVRTSLAMGRTDMEQEEWMSPLLEQDPSLVEVSAMVRACTPSSLAFYARRPEVYPNWGYWIEHYGLGQSKPESTT